MSKTAAADPGDELPMKLANTEASVDNVETILRKVPETSELNLRKSPVNKAINLK